MIEFFIIRYNTFKDTSISGILKEGFPICHMNAVDLANTFKLSLIDT